MHRLFPLLALAFVSSSAMASVLEISFDLDPTVDVGNGVLAVEYDASMYLGAGAVALDFAGVSGTSAGVPNHQIVAFQNYFNLPVIGYSVYSVYGGGAGVAVGVNATAAAGLVGNPWPFDIYSSHITSEASVQSALTNGDGSVVNSMTSELGGLGDLTSFGDSTTLVAFSNGRNVGTARATLAPEPATMAVLAFGALGLLRKRTRRN